MKYATIADVAKKSGMSSRTVTRVLQGGHKVAPETKRRVNEALKELNYSPDPIAQALKTNRSMFLGVIVQDLITEVLVKKLIAFEREASGQGYRIILGITEGDFAKERTYITDYSRMCDGIFLFVDWPVGANRENLEILRTQRKPYVLIDGSSHDGSCACIDRGIGVREALEKVHDKYSSFIYLNDAAPAEKDERYRAFRDFLRSIGKDGQSERLVGEGGAPFDLGYKNGDCVAERENTLVFCQSDRMAMGLLKRLTQLDVEIPGQVGIIGFDDDSYAPYTCKALSTIHQPVQEVSEAAFALMISQLQGSSAGELRTVPTRFIGRDTTL